jgi:hypothetical protein
LSLSSFTCAVRRLGEQQGLHGSGEKK